MIFQQNEFEWETFILSHLIIHSWKCCSRDTCPRTMLEDRFSVYLGMYTCNCGITLWPLSSKCFYFYPQNSPVKVEMGAIFLYVFILVFFIFSVYRIIWNFMSSIEIHTHTQGWIYLQIGMYTTFSGNNHQKENSRKRDQRREKKAFKFICLFLLSILYLAVVLTF